MKLNIIKLFVISIFLYLTMFNIVGVVKANAPTLVGRVVTTTGAPVAGVWVKWVDGTNRFRFRQTDQNGNYDFVGWHDYTPAEIAVMRATPIDSNLDGINDTFLADDSPVVIQAGWDLGFGCWENPHSFSVVPPVGLNGTFSQVTGISFDNGQGTLVLPDIIFTSSSPMPTPSPTPTGLTTRVVNFGIAPASGISGNIFYDINQNGVQDVGENVFTGGALITVTGATYAQTTTDANGNYTLPSLPNGSYTVYVTVPDNYHATTSTNIDVTIAPGKVVNFGIISSYSINGNVFNDANKNLKMDSGEKPSPTLLSHLRKEQ